MIARRLILLTIAVVCAAGLFASVIFYFLAGRVIQDQVEKRGKLLLQAVAKQALETFRKGDFENGFKGVVRSLKLDADVSTVIIIDGEGSIIGHSEPEKIGQKLFLSSWDQEVLKSATPLIRYDSKNARYIIGMAIEGPRSYSDGGTELSLPSGASGISLGAMYLGLSQENINLQIAQTVYVVVASIGILVIIACVVMVAVTKKIIHPLQLLNIATQELATGNLNAQVKIFTEDEVGQLAISFNTMTKRLRETTISKNSLSAIVEQKTKALKDANQTLLEANLQLKNLQELESKFVSMASHELRTPLTSISGFAAMMQKYGERLNGEQREKYLGAIVSESARLTRMINETLDLKKIQHGKIELNPTRIDVKAVAEKVLDELRIRPNQPQYKSAFDGGALIAMLDEDKIKQVMINLLGNAAKYTPLEKSVTLEGYLVNNKTIVLNVRDEGPGIPKELWAKLFHPFARANDDVARKTVGTGLGLAITKSLIETMGGRIRAENLRTGAQFTVILPRGSINE
ncbi:MAG: HAMP domain-containing protein [Elusimicrobia bacterium]|nr:HAMP domain-containing protein [Elusimicrobiota bacterium]